MAGTWSQELKQSLRRVVLPDLLLCLLSLLSYITQTHLPNFVTLPALSGMGHSTSIISQENVL